jgi:hypothetical protein
MEKPLIAATEQPCMKVPLKKKKGGGGGPTA